MCFENKWLQECAKRQKMSRKHCVYGAAISAFSALEQIWTRLFLLVIHSHITEHIYILIELLIHTFGQEYMQNGFCNRCSKSTFLLSFFSQLPVNFHRTGLKGHLREDSEKSHNTEKPKATCI